MKKHIAYIFVLILLSACGTSKTIQSKKTTVKVSIDLVNSTDDKLNVTLEPGTITSDLVTFYIPETVPGTYSDDDYGKYVEQVEAFTSKGELLPVERTSDNTWNIQKATTLASIHYVVSDTYDIEGEHDIFSPSGTNFKKGQQYMLNLHALVGYIKNQEDLVYTIDINRSEKMEASTSLPIQTNENYTPTVFENQKTVDSYIAQRYFEVIDNPIMYNIPNKEVFDIGGITIELSVYSPSGTVKASDLKPNIEKMMEAQKAYLGAMNTTDKYTILLYLSTVSPDDAQGFGALEHHTSTVVVLPESMPQEAMDAAMIDVVAHEFFHIVTPLNLHSAEIHKFRYNDPKMSQHLWMYEGITEYFAQHFQVQQGLINAPDFYNTLTEKIARAKSYDDTMSFTEMSANVLEEPYASSYGNVYQKGALIGMCLDILLRENSNGEKGVLDLMRALTERYGSQRPFDDQAIIPQITEMTSPVIGAFFQDHVIGTIPINYSAYFDKVGLEYTTIQAPTGYFLEGNQPYINGSQATNEVFIQDGIELHSFFKELGIEGGDVIKSINGKTYDISNVYALISDSNGWKVDDPVTFIVKRGEKELTLTGKVSEPQISKPSITELQYFTEGPELRLRNSWLKGS